MLFRSPSEVKGTDDERLAAFRQTMLTIQKRLQLLVSLPLAGINLLALQNEARNLSKA